MIDAELRVCVVVPRLFEPSQPWVYRQIDMMQPADFQILHWGYSPFADSMKRNFKSLRAVKCVDVEGQVSSFEVNGAGRWAHRLKNIRTRNFFAADSASIVSATKIVQEHGSNVILAHFGHTALCFLPIAERANIPIVAHFHGLDLSQSLRNNRWYRWSLGRNIKRFSCCIVVGSHQRDILIELGMPADRIHLLPCGVPTNQFRPMATISGSPFRFAIVARLVKSKGIDISMRAFARTLAKYPDSELVVAGDGIQRDELDALAKTLSLGEKIRFLGVVDDVSVAQLLRDSNAFLHHALETNGVVEGFGVAVAEAAASGLPVVVSKSGGLMDQVNDGESGLVVPMGDVDAMAEAMLKLCGNRDFARRLGEAGRRRMVKEFDAQFLARRLRSTLVTTLENQPKQRKMPGMLH